MSDFDRDDACNYRADHYLIARAVGVCLHCGAATRFVAVMLPEGHEARALPEESGHEAGGSTAPADPWDRVGRRALVFHVEFLPEAVRRRLQEHAPGYRLAASETTQCSYWANHCERCGAMQEDHELFCEPEGAFLPMSPAAAKAILLLPVGEPCAAGAGGYAIDPEFLGGDGG